METVYVARIGTGGFALVWESQRFGANGWSGPFQSQAAAREYAQGIADRLAIDLNIEDVENEVNALYDAIHGER